MLELLIKSKRAKGQGLKAKSTKFEARRPKFDFIE
jgi:hypothetical protein